MKRTSQIATQLICTLAKKVAPFASQYCRGKFYQPEEPSGLQEFAAKRTKKKNRLNIVSFVLVFALFLTGIGITAQATEKWDIASSHIQERNLIKKSVKLLNNHAYSDYANCFVSEKKAQLCEMIETPSYQLNYTGFFNVKNISVISIEETDLTAIPVDIRIKYADDYNISAYKVVTDVTAYCDDEFYYTGERQDVFSIGEKNGTFSILSINSLVQPDYAHMCDEIQPFAISTSCSLLPKSIKVLMPDESIVSVDFKTYVQKCSAHEVGYDERGPRTGGTNWITACVLAVKTYAVYHYLHVDPTLGYHVGGTSGNGQVYNPNEDINTCPNIKKVIDATWDLAITNASGKIILTEYRSGTKPDHQQYNHAGSGKMLQNKAWEMAQSGKSYTAILSYFYSNSDVSSKTTIKIVEYTNHIWVDYGSYKKCKRCNRILPKEY